MAGEGSPQHESLGSDAMRNDGGEMMAGRDSAEEPTQRPLQLPRVGWDTGEEDEEDATGRAHPPAEPGVEIPPIRHGRGDGDGVVQRAMSRSSHAELAPIPEEKSMHGTWPDCYPDLSGCYDDDDQKKYKYRRFGPNVKQRLCVLLSIVLAVVVGSRTYTRMARNHTQQLQPGDGGDDSMSSNVNGGIWEVASDDDVGISDSNGDDRFSDEDMYATVVATLDPIELDSAAKWDGSYFHAYELCGSEFDRVPCPYIAYCPLGPGHAPLGGVKVDLERSAWAPIYNPMDHYRNPALQMPDWVQLGSEGTCELYSRLHPRAPIQGDGRAEITRHVACCLQPKGGKYLGGNPGPESGMLSNDPDFLDRPPGLEEDEARKPIPIREEVEGNGQVQSAPGPSKGKETQPP